MCRSPLPRYVQSLAIALAAAALPLAAMAWSLSETDQGLALRHRIGTLEFLFQCRASHPGTVLFWVTGRDFGDIDTITLLFETPGGGGGEVRVGVTASADGLSGAMPLTEAVTRHLQGGTVMRMAVAGESVTIVHDMVPRDFALSLARGVCGAPG